MDRKKHTDLINIAIIAALDAGKLVMQYFNQTDKKIKLKWNFTPVTKADKEASILIIKLLKDTNIPIISEEEKIPSYDIRKTWDSFWIIDPIDGTNDFINGGKDFTVNIALVEGNDVKLGIIYVPVTGELFYGLDNVGSFKHTVKNHFIDTKELFKNENKINPTTYTDDLTIVASRSYINRKTQLFINDVKQYYDNFCIINRGSSLKFCLVAEGSANLYPRLSKINEWDIAAGHAIAKAAGCFIIQPDGISEVKYNSKRLCSPCFFVANNKNTVKKMMVNLNI